MNRPRHNPDNLMWPDVAELIEARETGDGRSVTIAILDTGIDASHPALAGAEFSPAQAAEMTPQGARVTACDADDRVGHGTAIAGIIHSLAPRATILSIKVLDCRKRQHRHDVIRAGAMKAIESGAHILNCSFGLPGVPVTLPLYKNWTDLAFTRGRHVVAASSNSDPDESHWPASFPQVISTTAGDLSPRTIRYRPDSLISFEAAGINIPVLATGSGSATLTGSSFAAAHLSGILARLLSSFPTISPSFAHEALRGLALHM